MPALRPLAEAIDRQRGHLFPWAPVFLGAGVGLYFSLPFEPAVWLLAAAGAAVLALLLAGLRWVAGRPLLLAVALILAGLVVAALRAHGVAAPVLSYRYYGPVEGRIVAIDRSASDKVRLTLDRVVLERTSPERTPGRVRVSLHGLQGFVEPRPGLRVMMTAHLSAPQGAVEPGGFDFRRNAWFDGIGAVGYTRTPVLTAAPAETGRAGLLMTRLRDRISRAVQEAMPGRTGAFAAAIMTGDRSGMDQPTLEALRASNLAHLLAISGLHMGLLTGFVFAALRYGLALVPPVALRLDTRKIAAIVALAAAAFYLGLSGGNVATERAFVMVAVMLVAVLLDRRAISLRSVALAALIILLLRPEAMIGPGFQMSFAATVALVGAFELLRERRGPNLPAWTAPIATVVISSGIAGLATAPVGAAHFNQLAHYGLVANVVSVPLMGAVVIPGAVLAAVLAPFGLGWIGLWVMTPPIAWILGVADAVAGLAGAVSHVPAPPDLVLPLFAVGGLTLILWQGRGRLAGAVPLALAAVLWAQVERPPLLVSATGGLVGVMTDQGRALSKPRGDGFAAQSWLENDGDGGTSQAEAAGRPGFRGDPGRTSVTVGGIEVVHVTGRGAADRVAAACAAADLVISSVEAPRPTACPVLDEVALADIGAVAIWPRPGGFRLVASDGGPTRLWSGATAGGFPDLRKTAEPLVARLAALRAALPGRS